MNFPKFLVSCHGPVFTSLVSAVGLRSGEDLDQVLGLSLDQAWCLCFLPDYSDAVSGMY